MIITTRSTWSRRRRWSDGGHSRSPWASDTSVPLLQAQACAIYQASISGRLYCLVPLRMSAAQGMAWAGPDRSIREPLLRMQAGWTTERFTKTTQGWPVPCVWQAATEGKMTKHLNGAALIAAERQRQIDEELWTAEHDDHHENAELLEAAISYVGASIPRHVRNIRPAFWWPVDWDLRWFKPKDSISNLVKAGALIAAEIDRLQRLGKDGGK